MTESKLSQNGLVVKNEELEELTEEDFKIMQEISEIMDMLAS